MEEEIKLLIIIILTFCTLMKVRTTWRTYPAAAKVKEKEQLRMEEQAEEVYDASEDSLDLEAVAIAENRLFPPQPRRPVLTQPQQPYRQCLQGITYEEDQSNLYSYRQKDSNPFFRPGRRLLRTNEECLREIQHLLVDPPTPEPQPPALPVPMSAEEEDSTPEPKVGLLKRKNIAKQARFGRRQERSKASPTPHLFSRLPLQAGKKKKKQKRNTAVVDIDKEIERRYEEIRVLERLKKREKGA